MKVAICSFGFPEFTVSLAHALEPYCEPLVIIPASAKSAIAAYKNVKTIPYVLSESVFSKFRACSEMHSLIADFSPDVIHFQGWSPLLTPFLPSLKRFPIVYSWHDPVPHEDDVSWAMAYTQRLLINASRKVILLSRAMEPVAKEVHPASAGKLNVVPHGIFDFYVQGDQERPAELQPGDRFILCFGRVARYKGVEDLIRAFLDANLGNEYKLVIAGRHIYRVSLPPDVDSRVLILNRFVSDDVLRYLFRNCSLVVLPYRDATQSGVLMLAYAFGKPVLTTTVGGIPEMLEEGVTGVSVPPRNPVVLSGALRRMISSPDALATMGERGHQYARAHYGWEAIASDTLRIYREAISVGANSE